MPAVKQNSQKTVKAQNPPRTREEAIAQMIQRDPQRAARLLREILRERNENL